MEDIDIWRTAKILIDAHGDGALAEASRRERDALEDGLPDAVAVWKRVMRAVEELQRGQPQNAKILN